MLITVSNSSYSRPYAVADISKWTSDCGPVSRLSSDSLTDWCWWHRRRATAPFIWVLSPTALHTSVHKEWRLSVAYIERASCVFRSWPSLSPFAGLSLADCCRWHRRLRCAKECRWRLQFQFESAQWCRWWKRLWRYRARCAKTLCIERCLLLEGRSRFLSHVTDRRDKKVCYTMFVERRSRKLQFLCYVRVLGT